MKAFIELFRDAFYRKRKSYRTKGFVFRHPAIAGRIFSSICVTQKKTIKSELFLTLDSAMSLKKSTYSPRTIRYLIILKELSVLLSTAASFLQSLKIRKSPNIFSCIRNKLMPKNDGKSDLIAREDDWFLNFPYVNYWDHFYGKSKNIVRIGREKFKSSDFRA